MKKFLVAFIAILILLSPNVSKAQQSEYDWVLSAGVGYSLWYNISQFSNNSISGIPPIYFNADFETDDHFSLGLGISHFSIISGRLRGRGLSGTNTNIGTRFLFHFGDNPKLDHYAGFRLGVCIKNFEGELEGVIENGITPCIPRAFYGMRAYFSDDVGVNLEVGIGPPYSFNGGIVFRIK